MNFLTLTSAFAVIYFLSGCSKNYNCVCTGPGAGNSNIVSSYHTTKSKAKKMCSSYYKEHYIGWSETSCEIK